MCQFFIGRCLSLPTQVSTTIILPSDSTTNAWIAPIVRPSSVRKCGFSHACWSSLCGVASSKKNVPGEEPSISTIRVISAAPTRQRVTG
jgi:hypothetical protein